MWHLKNNLAIAAARFSTGGNLRKLFGRCAYAATHLKYIECLKDLLAVGGEKTAQFMQALPPQNFANAYFTGRRYGELCSNIAESFNNWIFAERPMPICVMLDRIRRMVMKTMADRHDDSWKWTSVLCTEMENLLAKRIQEARPMKVFKSSAAE
ncbi:Zinc finger protein [Thalictrum thalictroides]|uniref:Zinc finger protein n=1 Tax=Thalictrum thalictroides TaxID=46969 RepID=A0A7J6VT45_THATH|nr:Zinc finger protein [Thalictrum thalictroides]